MRIFLRIYVLAGLFMSLTNYLFAQQFGGGINYNGGGTYQFHKVHGTVSFSVYDSSSGKDVMLTDSINEIAKMPGFSFSLNTTIFNFNKDISIGNTTTLRFGQTFGDVFRFFIDVPVYITFRLGAKATNKTRSSVGLGIGAGYQFTYVYLTGRNELPDYNSPEQPVYQALYFHPAFTSDFYFSFNKRLYFIIGFNYLITDKLDSDGIGDVNNEFWRNIGFSFRFTGSRSSACEDKKYYKKKNVL